jgi:hypothetical protein
LRFEVDRLPEEHEKRRRVISPWKSSVPRKERRFSGVKFHKGRLLIEATVKVNREMTPESRMQGARSQETGARRKDKGKSRTQNTVDNNYKQEMSGKHGRQQ